MSDKKPKKKLVPIIIGAVAIVGAIVGCGLAGIIPIPGLSPSKKKPSALYGEAGKLYGETDDLPVANSEPPKPKPKPKRQPQVTPEPLPDKEKGTKKLAKLWNSMPTDQLIKVVGSWKDRELAEVMVMMDPEKAAALLSALPPDRASKLSVAIRAQASLVVAAKTN